jgi:hypothetical protein
MKQKRPQAPRLSDAQRSEMAGLYGHWRARFSGKSGDARVAELSRKAGEMVHWDEAKARRSGNSGDAAGVAAFVERVGAVAGRAQSMEAARSAPSPVTDDDMVFAVALATDRHFNALLPGWAVFELVGHRAKDRALAGRCLRLAGAIGGDERDPHERLKLFEAADQALSQGADDPLRAEVVNEIAVCQLNLRQPQAALAAAERAAALATKCGLHGFGRMARGNVANALLGMGRIADALKIFEGLERDQLAAGERDMAGITRQNIDACHAYLRQQSRGR